MTTREITSYYTATENRDLRSSLVSAVERVKANFEEVVAVDCGCGSGRDIAFLLDQGFVVYGFDLEEEAIRRCHERFSGQQRVHLQQASFASFDYPQAELISADASLFYCPENEFPEVWKKLCDALVSKGVFVGSFLGARDTTASMDYDPEKYWPDVMTVNEASLKQYLTQFDVINWTEHELDGKTHDGLDHHWHVFELLLEKR